MRAGALRSLPIEFKGASMLIEEDKEKYMQWALRNCEFETLETAEERFAFFRTLQIDYVVTRSDFSRADSLVHTCGDLRIYKLNQVTP